MLNYLKHKEIDKGKWDDCVNSAVNPSIYVTSWYLDILSASWEGIIFFEDGQYQAVMPVMPQKKGPFLYLTKPNLAQQLGLIYRDGYGGKECHSQALDVLKTRFSLIRYPFNHSNPCPCTKDATAQCGLQKNHILDLSRSYREIKNGYRRDRKARLIQAQQMGLTISRSGKTDKMLFLLQNYVADKIYGGVAKADLDRLRKIMDHGLRTQSGFFMSVQNQHQDTLSMAFFLLYNGRLIYLQCANTEEARKVNANTLLIDHVIRENAGKRVILDFEGAEVEGVSDFYKSFGAKEEEFYLLEINNLPYFIRKIQTIRKFIVRELNFFPR